MRRFLLQLLALAPIPVIVLLVIWAGKRPLPPPPATGAGGGHGAAGRELLPRSLPSGWKLEGKATRFDKKTLFDRIDGAAPVYIKAGFVGSVGGDYRGKGLQDPVQVDIYDMGSSAQALGMYAAERDSSYSFIEVGEEGYISSGTLNFWRGRYYGKLAGYGEGKAIDDALKSLASDLAKALGKNAKMKRATDRVLAVLALLPAEGRKPHSGGFARAPLRALDGLGEAFYSDYQAEQKVYRLFLVPAKDAADAAARFARAKRALEKKGAKVEEGQQGKAKVLVASAGQTSSLLLLSGRGLAGGIDLPSAKQLSDAKMHLASCLERLSGKKKN